MLSGPGEAATAVLHTATRSPGRGTSARPPDRRERADVRNRLRRRQVTCRTSRSRCPPRARRRAATPSTPGTEVRRGPLLAALHGCILGLALLRAAGRILVPSPPPTHPWPRPWDLAWTSHEHFSARDGRAPLRSCCSPSGWRWATWSASTTPACRTPPSSSDSTTTHGRSPLASGCRCSPRGSRCCSGSPPVCGRVLDRLSGGDPLAHAIVPAAALFGGLMITGVSLDVASAYAALSEEFTPDPDTVRALGMAGSVLALTGLIGGGVLVAVTTRIAQQARALPAWAVWASYAVAGLSLTGFWSGAWRPWPSRCGSSAPSSGCCARRGGHRRRRPSRHRAHRLGGGPHAPDRHRRLTPQPTVVTARLASQPGLRTRRGTVPRGSVSRRREGPAASGAAVHEPRSCSAGNLAAKPPLTRAPALRSARVHALRPPR